MPIKWKNNKNLKPAVILSRIEKYRTVSPEGKVSFDGFEVHNALPALQSMLKFPSSAVEVGRGALVWKALSSITKKLTPESFEEAINAALAAVNKTNPGTYHVLTSISLNSDGLPTRLKVEDATIRLVKGSFPKRYRDRAKIIAQHQSELPVEASPSSYTNVVVVVNAKTPFGAAARALRALDIQRAIWCLRANARMEFVGQEWSPINQVRLGSIHTVHDPAGKPVTDEVWFEPSYREASVFKPSVPKSFRAASVRTVKRLNRCPYRQELVEALLRYVQALDEPDQDNAVVKLWGALESMLSPGNAQYELVTRRTAFLFGEVDYHRQILEHLREYRNEAVHSGVRGSEAKANGYQLQFYFDLVFRFHLTSGRYFGSLAEANAFLDLPSNKEELIKRRKLIAKAIRFRS